MFVEIKVRGYHLDVYQHVNNARYLEFLEEARWEFIDKTGFDQIADDMNCAFVVVNININYLDATYINDLLKVTVNIGRIGNKSAQFEQEVLRVVEGQEDQQVANAQVTFCLMDKKTGKAIAMSDEIKARLESMKEVAL